MLNGLLVAGWAVDAFDNPLFETLPQNVLVAKLVNCTGTPVFKLRGILTGRKGIAGGFTVDPMTGEVRMNVVHTGMMVIVR